VYAIVAKDNFIEVLEEGMEDEEYHAWRRIMELGTADNRNNSYYS